jgi:hypothetical protein
MWAPSGKNPRPAPTRVRISWNDPAAGPDSIDWSAGGWRGGWELGRSSGVRPAVSPLPLMQLSIGFWSFKALASAHELDLFARLSGTDGRTIDELAEMLGVAQRPVELLVTACASIGLLERRDGRYVNSTLADEFLVPGKDFHFGGWLRMLDRRLYPAWGRLTEAVRTNRPTSWNPDEQAHFFDSEDP